ncbi:MAG: hypothetical protein ACI3ZL_01045 [Candidatus Cryptobacteroides sp.]
MKSIRMTFMTILAMLFLAGCEKPQNEVVEPVFPDEIGSLDVNPGDVKTINVVANLDWELELVAEGGSSWFWIEEGEGRQPVSRIKGMATEGQEVEIFVSDVEEYDKVRTCDVVLSMKGQSKTLATLVRGSKDRNISVWTAKSDEYGFIFSQVEGTIYEYEDDALASGSSLSLVWPSDLNFYQMALKVTADFPWELAELPEWLVTTGLSDDRSQRIGTVEFRLTANIEKISLEEQKGKVAFLGGENEMMSFEVVLPESKNTIDSNFPDTIEATAEGKFVSDMGTEQELLFKNITAAEGFKVYTPYFNGQWWYSSPDWIEISTPYGAWDNEDPSKIQTITYQLKLSQNTSSESRTAYVLALPASIASSLVDPDYDLFTGPDGTGEIKDEYKPYIISTLVQKGGSASYEEFFLLGENFQTEGARMTVMQQTDEWYSTLSETGCPFLYKLVFSYADGAFASGDTAVKWMSAMQCSTDLLYLEDNKTFVEVSYDDYGNTQFIPKTSACGSERLECFVVFFDATSETPIAIVDVIYNPGGETTAPFAFVYPDYVKGATLEKYSGELLSELKSYTIPESAIYILTYTVPEPQNTLITCPGSPYYDCAWGNETESPEYWLTHEMSGANQMMVFMSEAGKTDYFLFGSQTSGFTAALVCTNTTVVE